MHICKIVVPYRWCPLKSWFLRWCSILPLTLLAEKGSSVVHTRKQLCQVSTVYFLSVVLFKLIVTHRIQSKRAWTTFMRPCYIAMVNLQMNYLKIVKNSVVYIVTRNRSIFTHDVKSYLIGAICECILHICCRSRWWSCYRRAIQQQFTNPLQYQLPWVCLQLLWLLLFHYASLGMLQPPNGCCGNVLWWWVSIIWCLNICQVLILVFTIPPISS